MVEPGALHSRRVVLFIMRMLRMRFVGTRHPRFRAVASSSIVLGLSLMPAASYSFNLKDEATLFEYFQNGVGSDMDLELLEFLHRHPLDVRVTKHAVEHRPELPLWTQTRFKLLQSEIRKHPEWTLEDAARLDWISALERDVLLYCCRCVPLATSRAASATRSPHNSSVREHANSNGYSIEWKQRQSIVLEKARSYDSTTTLFRRLASNERLRFHCSDAEVILCADKDAAEPTLADAYNVSLRWEASEHTSIVVGGFRMRSGQGLVLNPGALHSPLQIHDYSPSSTCTKLAALSSTSPLGAFQGIACEHSITSDSNNRWLMFCAMARTKRDASLDSSGSIIQALSWTGLHRDSSEQALASRAVEQSLLSCFEYGNDRLRACATILGLEYDHPIESESASLLRGRRGLLGSLTVIAHSPADESPWGLCTEIARDASGNLAWLADLTTEIEGSRCALRARSYSAAFRSPYASSPGAYGTASNEQGLAFACFTRPSAHCEIRAVVDYYHSLKPRYASAFRAQGLDLTMECRYTVRRDFEYVFRFRDRRQREALRNDVGMLGFQQGHSSDVVARVRRSMLSDLELRAEVQAQYRELHFGTEDFGLAGRLYMKAQLTADLSCSFSQSVFSTQSFDTALYLGEEQAPGQWTASALYGQGARSSVLVSWTPRESLCLSLHYSRTSRNDTEEMSSGFSATPSSHLSTLLFQASLLW